MKHESGVVAVRELSPLEVAVVALLQEDGRMQFAEMSKRLDQPEAAVRRLVHRLVAEHVIAITAVANPRLLGLEAMGWVGLRVDWSRAEGLPDRMLEIRGVDYVATTTGAYQVMAEIGARDLADLMARIELIRALPGVRASETFLYLDLFHQEFSWVGPGSDRPRRRPVAASQPIGDLEQSLILQLRRDGRRSFRRVAQELLATERQIRSAYARLTSSGTVRVIAVLNPARMGLQAMAWLGIWTRAGLPVERVAAAVADEPRVDYVVICTGRFDVLAEVACTDAEEVASVVGQRLGRIEGVEEIEVFSYLRLQYRDESVWSAGRASALERDEGIVRRRRGGAA